MSFRLLALLLLLAVLPTVEAAEQMTHLIEHVFEAEAPDHTAHHDDSHGDEHGCTGLIHLCSGHHPQVIAAVAVVKTSTVELQDAITIGAPSTLVDLNALEPPHRPPIG